MKKIKLLLVDDHQIVLDGIQAFLEKEPDMEITGTAHNGAEALRLLELQPADVVIMDISMPEMDGIETARHIRKHYPDTKIILLTMQGDGHFILNAMKMGVHGYVLKEKSKEILVAAINNVYQGSSYWSPDLLPRIANAQLLHNDADETVHLTDRERQTICMMADDPSLTAKEIGERLFIAEVTVHTHIRNAKKKLGLHRNMELVKYALEKDLCS